MDILLDDSKRQLAESVAEALKQELLALVLGRETDAYGCACGGRHNGRAEAIDIAYPGAFGDEAYNIGMWTRWSVTLKEKCTSISPYSMPLSDFVEKSRLFTMFRTAFRDVGVPVEMPAVFFRSGLKELTNASSQRHGFTGNERILVIQPGQSKYVRPTSDVSHSCWESARLTIMIPQPESLPVVTFDVDSSWLHKPVIRDNREYFGAEVGVANLLTVHVGEGVSRKDNFYPVARLISYDAASHEHSFELAEGVEEFQR